jgi:hypothetical protein
MLAFLVPAHVGQNARTIEACVDRLTMMGADHELKLIARRLSRLTFRAAPPEEAMRALRYHLVGAGEQRRAPSKRCSPSDDSFS